MDKSKEKKLIFLMSKLNWCEVNYHPFPDIYPIADKYRGKTFYYDDDCEIKLIPKHWVELHNREVKEEAVPCEEGRQGFDPETKTMLYMDYFLFADTYPVS